MKSNSLDDVNINDVIEIMEDVVDGRLSQKAAIKQLGTTRHIFSKQFATIYGESSIKKVRNNKLHNEEGVYTDEWYGIERKTAICRECGEEFISEYNKRGEQINCRCDKCKYNEKYRRRRKYYERG